MVINILKNEHWWGGLTDMGAKMPFGEDSDIEVKLAPMDQGAFLYVSDKGRYIYSPKKYTAVFKDGKISIDGDDEIYFDDGYETLKDAHKAVVEKFFALEECTIDKAFFTVPQFNTWMALGYNQNENDILKYAQSIIDNGFTPGIFMIDEGWSEDYGVYDFYPGRFTDPKGMIAKLHQMGFKVMLWVTPNISPDSNAYRELSPLGYLIKNSDGEDAVRKWWNGYSCVLDLTNPDAKMWFTNKLKGCIEKYGADGFKFDAGDWYFYRDDDKTFEKRTDNEMTREYNELGYMFPYHEYRAAWNLRGVSIICRMQDKLHSWEDGGIKNIIPNTIAQGIIGCLYGCPDMIGGGALDSAGGTYDSELYVRWAQVNAYCAMMQISIAPWKVLSDDECAIVRKYTDIHEKMSDKILSLIKNASHTGEPVVRCMEYEFPNQGFETIIDQYMFGDDMLIAPIIQKGVTKREVKLPEGTWQGNDGAIYMGGQTICVDAPIDVIPVFNKM